MEQHSLPFSQAPGGTAAPGSQTELWVPTMLREYGSRNREDGLNRWNCWGLCWLNCGANRDLSGAGCGGRWRERGWHRLVDTWDFLWGYGNWACMESKGGLKQPHDTRSWGEKRQSEKRTNVSTIWMYHYLYPNLYSYLYLSHPFCPNNRPEEI